MENTEYYRDMVDAICGDYNRTAHVARDGNDIHVSLCDDFKDHNFPIDIKMITELNDLFDCPGQLFVNNMSLGDDFRPNVWLCFEGVF